MKPLKPPPHLLSEGATRIYLVGEWWNYVASLLKISLNLCAILAYLFGFDDLVSRESNESNSSNLTNPPHRVYRLVNLALVARI